MAAAELRTVGSTSRIGNHPRGEGLHELQPAQQQLRLLDAYYTCGGSFIQTVGLAPNSVTAEFTESASEDIVGRWRETRGISRDGLVLASRINIFRPHVYRLETRAGRADLTHGPRPRATAEFIRRR